MLYSELNALYPNRVVRPTSQADLMPPGRYGVYILALNERPIVLGHGRRNRARVIFDDTASITPNHIKSIFVRLYHLYGSGTFARYLINCADKTEAIEIETSLHHRIGGNSRDLPKDILDKLFSGIEPEGICALLLKIALTSSYDGISDLRRWKKARLIKESDWNIISFKLRLSEAESTTVES